MMNIQAGPSPLELCKAAMNMAVQIFFVVGYGVIWVDVQGLILLSDSALTTLQVAHNKCSREETKPKFI